MPESPHCAHCTLGPLSLLYWGLPTLLYWGPTNLPYWGSPACCTWGPSNLPHPGTPPPALLGTPSLLHPGTPQPATPQGSPSLQRGFCFPSQWCWGAFPCCVPRPQIVTLHWTENPPNIHPSVSLSWLAGSSCTLGRL